MLQSKEDEKSGWLLLDSSLLGSVNETYANKAAISALTPFDTASFLRTKPGLLFRCVSEVSPLQGGLPRLRSPLHPVSTQGVGGRSP